MCTMSGVNMNTPISLNDHLCKLLFDMVVIMMGRKQRSISTEHVPNLSYVHYCRLSSVLKT